MRDLEWLKEGIGATLLKSNMFGVNFIEYKKTKDNILNLIDQVEQPEKPVIPGYVAEYIEEQRKAGLASFVHKANPNTATKAIRWFYDGGNAEIFLRAWLDGYTVEEKKYVVRTSIGTYFVLDDRNRGWDYTDLPEGEDSTRYATKFKDKKRAEAIALVFGGTVVEVHE